MILSEFKELMLSKTINRKVIPDDIRLQERVFTALKKIAMDTIPLRLVVQDPTGHSIMRRVDEITYIRFPDMPIQDDSEIDIDMFLLDAAALYVMAGLEKEKASVYMGMYWEILEENDNRLCETYLSTATNESGFDDANYKFSGGGGNSLVVNYGQSSGSTGGGNFLTNAELQAKIQALEDAGFITGYTVTEQDVTNHQEALTITSSQISDLGDFVVDENYIHTDNNFTDELKTKLDGLSNYQKPTSEPISYITNLQQTLDSKVVKITGKGLSTEDYTTTEKNKLSNIASGAEVNVNADWSATSGDAKILNKPTTLNGYGITDGQPILVSGTNIKTINGGSILGGGNLDVSAGSGGYSANVYLTTETSTTNTNYNQLSYTPSANETILSVTVNNSEALLADFIFDGDVKATNIPAGEWGFHFHCRVSSFSATTTLRFEVFKRSSSAVETILFSKSSEDIDNTIFELKTILITQPIYNILSTDRIGIKIYGNTTRTTSTTIYLIVGNGNAAYFTTPLEIRHSQLRARDEDDSHPIGAITGLDFELERLSGTSGSNTGDQTITLEGDVTGGGTGTFTTTIADSGVIAGTYKSVTVNSKGLVTNGTNPTTLNGYGITDVYSKTEIDTIVGDINSALDTINGEVI